MVLVKSQVKEATELNVAADVYEALGAKVIALIKDAEARAKANGRKTIKPYDL
jgi:histone H3/H4